MFDFNDICLIYITYWCHIHHTCIQISYTCQIYQTCILYSDTHTLKSRWGFTVTRTFLFIFFACHPEKSTQQHKDRNNNGDCWGSRGLYVILTFVFSSSSSIFSTMPPSRICRSHDAREVELTGWVFNQPWISWIFSALFIQRITNDKQSPPSLAFRKCMYYCLSKTD